MALGSIAHVDVKCSPMSSSHYPTLNMLPLTVDGFETLEQQLFHQHSVIYAYMVMPIDNYVMAWLEMNRENM